MPHINRIELRGFKSFGTTKVPISLARGFTAVVGENGHGKSNIADALSFVFGERSGKSMRVERFSDFIYAKDSKPVAPFAEVSIFIDNRDHGLALDNSEVMISRRLDRAGKSVYKINGKRTELQEIVDLLSPVIGFTDGYNFVRQGEIHKIVEKSPEELRQIIDGLAGVSEYEEKKGKAVSDLKAAEEQLGILGAKLGEISKNVDRFRTQAEDARKHKKIEQELEEVRAALLNKNVFESEREQKRLEQQAKKIESKKNALERRFRDLNKKANLYEDQANRFQELIDTKHNSDVIVKAGELRNLDSVLRSQLRKTNDDRKGVLEEMENAKASIESSGKSSGVFAEIKKFNELQKEFERLSAALQKAKTLDEAKQSIEQVSRILEEIKGLVDGLFIAFSKGKISEVDAKQLHDISRLEVRLEVYDGQISELNKKLERAKSQLEKISAEEKKLRTSIDLLDQKKKKLAASARKFRDSANNIHEKVLPLSTRQMEINGKISSIEGEIKSSRKEIGGIKVDFSHLIHMDVPALEKKESELRGELEAIGEVNPRAIRDLREEETKHAAENGKFQRLEADKEAILKFMAEMDEKKKKVFMKTFSEVARHYSEIFRELSGIGTGKLILENEQSPLEGGLELEADFGDGLYRLRGLSGGQKTLTALAFLFALQLYRPTTFYVMDEIDQSLDQKNCERVANLLHKFSKDSQMLVITHHHNIAKMADRIFGITKEKGEPSRVLSVELARLSDYEGKGN